MTVLAGAVFGQFEPGRIHHHTPQILLVVLILRAMIEPVDLFKRLAVNETLFPRGIDVVLVSGDSIVAIPRTTRVNAMGV